MNTLKPRTSIDMSSTTTAPSLSLPESAPAAARAAFGLLRQLRTARSTCSCPTARSRAFGSGAEHEPRAAMRLHNWKVCGGVLRSGDIGFAESYIAGDWTTPDLVALLKVFIANRDAIESVIYGSWWGSLLYRVKHLLQSQLAPRQPQEHPRPLRPGQRVLPAVAGRDDELLGRLVRGRPEPRPGAGAAGQGAPRARRVPASQPGHRVLEIGCGWGALAEYATRRVRRAASPA